MNLCAKGLITKGLGLPAKNNLIFGLSRVQICVAIVTPTPTPTPTVTPTAVTGRPGGAGGAANRPWSNWGQDVEPRVDLITQELKINIKWKEKDKITKTFKIDKRWANFIVKRIKAINTVKYSFTVKIQNIKNRFKVKWK